MNYERVYYSLIQSRKSRGLDKSNLEGYYEKHHITPICTGGTDEKSNLVLLTAREHFIAHRLLAKAFPLELKLLGAVAAFQMRNAGRKLSSKQYEQARKAVAIIQRERRLGSTSTDETKIKIAVAMQNLVAEGRHYFQSEEHSTETSKRNLDLAAQGLLYSQTEEGRAKAAETLRSTNAKLYAEGRHTSQDPEWLAKTSARTTERNLNQSDAALAASSERLKALAKVEHTCQYCGKVGLGNSMIRHINICRSKQFH